MSKKSEFSNMCRTCMSTISRDGASNSTKQQYIYDKPSGREAETDCPTIIDILLSVQPQIIVPIKDDLPNIMCNHCIEQLQMTYNFLEMCKDTDERFHKMLKESCTPVADQSDEFDDTIEYVEEEETHIPKYEELEKITVDSCITENDTLEIVNALEMHDWPEFEDEPRAHDASDEDEGNAEYFDNPYSDASDSEWSSVDLKSKNQNLKQTPPRRKSKPILKSKIRNHSKNKVVKHRNLKDEMVDEALPPANDDGSISCQECELVLDNIPLWREHMREHRIGNSQKSNIQTKVGRPRKTYKCEFCGKVFPKITPYNNHVRTHTGEEPYLCMECGKSFKVVSSLNTHMLRHRGDRTFECPHCPKKFVCSSGLYGHMMVHNKEKPYVCDICGSAFHMAYMLKKHNLYHKGIKNFQCEYCELRFVTAEKQRRHMRTHTGEKPYRCKYCDRGFAQSNDCNKHLKQHLGENIYQCELCPLRFPLARDLRVHFATHKDDDEETRARNLEARTEEEKNLKIKLGIKHV